MKNKSISIISVPFSLGGPNEAAKDGPTLLLKNDLAGDLQELEYTVKIIYPPTIKLKKSNVKKVIFL